MLPWINALINLRRITYIQKTYISAIPIRPPKTSIITLPTQTPTVLLAIKPRRLIPSKCRWTWIILNMIIKLWLLRLSLPKSVWLKSTIPSYSLTLFLTRLLIKIQTRPSRLVCLLISSVRTLPDSRIQSMPLIHICQIKFFSQNKPKTPTLSIITKWTLLSWIGVRIPCIWNSPSDRQFHNTETTIPQRIIPRRIKITPKPRIYTNPSISKPIQRTPSILSSNNME